MQVFGIRKSEAAVKKLERWKDWQWNGQETGIPGNCLKAAGLCFTEKAKRFIMFNDLVNSVDAISELLSRNTDERRKIYGDVALWGTPNCRMALPISWSTTESALLIAEGFQHTSCELLYFPCKKRTLELESLITGLENYLQICCKNSQTRLNKKYGGWEPEHSNLNISLFLLWEKSSFDGLGFFLLIKTVANISSSKVLEHRILWGYSGELIIFHGLYHG